MTSEVEKEIPLPLPRLDEDPEEWGPDHDDLILTDEEISKGNKQGRRINGSDDEDNGLVQYG